MGVSGDNRKIGRLLNRSILLWNEIKCKSLIGKDKRWFGKRGRVFGNLYWLIINVSFALVRVCLLCCVEG